MKKCWILVGIVMMLCGCTVQEDFETMSDVYNIQQRPEASPVFFVVPEDAAAEVMENEDTGTLYFCDNYCIVVQTLQSGDMEATLQTVTGYSRERLQLMQRQSGGNNRYECTWVSAGENGDQVGRAVIIDDGNYHYALSVMADAAQAGKLTQDWQSLIDSFMLRTGK